MVNGGDNIAAYAPIFATRRVSGNKRDDSDLRRADARLVLGRDVAGQAHDIGEAATALWACFLPFILIGLGGLILYRSGALRLAARWAPSPLSLPRRPDLPIYGADLLGLAVTAERADHAARACSPIVSMRSGSRMSGSSAATSASTSSSGASRPLSPSAITISAAPARSRPRRRPRPSPPVWSVQIPRPATRRHRSKSADTRAALPRSAIRRGNGYAP